MTETLTPPIDATGPHHSTLGRARQIAGVLAHYELWTLLDVLDLGHLLPAHHTRPPAGASAHTPPVRLRLALAELGPTFIKLGQMLATRADLLPPAYQEELARLDDDAPTVPLEAVRATIMAELGQPPEAIFATFADTPLAAASIGQAHAATLHDGTPVVVKVRRPGAVEQIEEDLKLLHRLAVLASRRWAAAQHYDLVGLVQEFAQTLRAELDYLREGHNAERFAHNFAHDATVTIPRVFWETTTTRVLTLERLSGVKVTAREALQAAGLDCGAVASHGARLVLKMIFEDGFFHADLHPGNLFIQEAGRIGLIDFGLVGTVDAPMRETLAHLLLALTRQDTEGLVDAVLALGTAQQPVDRRALGRDLAPLLAQYVGQPLGAIAVGPLLSGVLSIVRQHHLVLPADLALLLKTVAMTEGMAAQLDPSFRLLDALAPYAQRLVLQQYAPGAWLQRLRTEGPELVWLATEFPQQIRRLVTALDDGDLKVAIHPTGMEPLVQRVERSGNRVVLGVLVAALLNGLAVLLAAERVGGSGHVLPAWVMGGLVVTAVLVVALGWSMQRAGRGLGT